MAIQRSRPLLRSTSWAVGAAALFIVCGATVVNGATQIIAITGNPAPDGNGVLSTFNKYSPAALNDVGQVAFYAALSGTSGGATDNAGIFLGTSSGRMQIARTGQTPPDGIGTYEEVGYRYGVMLNDVGQVAFAAQTGMDAQGNYTSGVFLASGGTTVPVVRTGQTAPSGNETFGGPWIWALNNSGQVLVESDVISSGGGWCCAEGLYVAGSNGIVEVVRSTQPTPDNSGIFSGRFTPVMNSSGQVAFWDLPSDVWNNGGVYLGAGGPIAQIAFINQPAPDGNGVLESTGAYEVAVNNAGKVAFWANFDQTSSGNYDDEGIFLATASQVVQIAREGQPAPGGNGVLDWFRYPAVNNAEQVAFKTGLRDTSGGANDNTAIYVGTGGPLTQIARTGQAAPDGNGVFRDVSNIPLLNDAGQVAFLGWLNGSSGGTLDDQGIYLGSSGAIWQIARKGQALAGSTIVDLSISEYADEENGLNSAGQVAYWAKLADGREMIALWTPPLDGDFNGDGIVDATDYVVWRKSNGTQQGFAMWRAKFGRSLGGAGAANVATSTVPEPAGLILMLLAAIMPCSIRIR